MSAGAVVGEKAVPDPLVGRRRGMSDRWSQTKK